MVQLPICRINFKKSYILSLLSLSFAQNFSDKIHQIRNSREKLSARNIRAVTLGVQLSAVQSQNIEIKHQRDRAIIAFQLAARKNSSEMTNALKLYTMHNIAFLCNNTSTIYLLFQWPNTASSRVMHFTLPLNILPNNFPEVTTLNSYYLQCERKRN